MSEWVTIDLSADGAIAPPKTTQWAPPKTETPQPSSNEASEWAYYLGTVARDSANKAATNTAEQVTANVAKHTQSGIQPINGAVGRFFAVLGVVTLHAGVTFIRPVLNIAANLEPTNPIAWFRAIQSLLDSDTEPTTNTASLAGLGYDLHQQSVINAVVETGQEMGMSSDDITIAIATCLVETQCRTGESVRAVDHDSIGPFQQRPSMGWPNSEDTVIQARAFFEALQDATGSTPGARAQDVQKSAYPHRYDQRMDDARAIMAALEGVSGKVLLEGDLVGQWTVTSDYGNRIAPTFGASTFHKGIDIDTPTGTHLYSPINGEIKCFEQPGGYGIYAQWATGMAGHLSHCIPGQYSIGEQFGITGNTGISTGPHLDLRMGAGPNFQPPTRQFTEKVLGIR